MLVSIPFIAGQWSLPYPVMMDRARRRMAFQSPSLRGSGRFGRGSPAFSSSLEVSIPFIAGQWSLRRVRIVIQSERLVSIPFIAGQWSLRAKEDHMVEVMLMFQSPSLRGSGRFQRAT